LEAGVTDAAKEKHIPVAKVEGNKVTVVVGSVEHPQTEEHHISFILLETSLGIQCRTLAHSGKPEATFLLQDGEKAIAAYEMCNLHGLWKVDL
ncbi:MAG: desulfoferrodoxin, partial [Spirochaetaceae bacterium]|nr:desulfoferrodoxin [Spirochaetaceae bacterium]